MRHDIAANELHSGDRPLRLHQPGGPEPVRVPVRPVQRHRRGGEGAGHHRVPPLQPGRGADGGRPGAAEPDHSHCGAQPQDHPLLQRAQGGKPGHPVHRRPALSLLRQGLCGVPASAGGAPHRGQLQGGGDGRRHRAGGPAAERFGRDLRLRHDGALHPPYSGGAESGVPPAGPSAAPCVHAAGPSPVR